MSKGRIGKKGRIEWGGTRLGPGQVFVTCPTAPGRGAFKAIPFLCHSDSLLLALAPGPSVLLQQVSMQPEPHCLGSRKAQISSGLSLDPCVTCIHLLSAAALDLWSQGPGPDLH